MRLILQAAALRDARLAWLSGHYARAAYHAKDYPPEPREGPRVPPDVQAEMERIQMRVKLDADARMARDGR